MVIVLGKVEVEPTDRETFIHAVSAVELATRQEVGCISYAFGQDSTRNDLFWLCESWSDLAALTAHLETPHIAAFRAAIAPLKVRSFIAKRYDAENEVILISR